MATDQQFCLRWNNHQSTLISVFDTLLENGTLVDCTLAAEGQYLKAHKVVLSACSPYLETLLSQHYEKHPIVILKDVKFSELKSMMDYMYRGEVNISQDQLGTFLKAAESLQIKGLSDNGDDARDVGSTTTKRTDAPSRPSVTPVRNNVESKRPAPPGDLSDASRDGSISPSSLRKRRRTRRPSQGDDPDLDTNNTCDLPTQAQSTLLPVPSSTVVPSPVSKPIVKQEPTSITRLDNSLNSPIAQESGLLKEKIEPPSEPLLEPKTEYLDYMNNENSIEVEDLTLDDDEEDLDSSMDASRPGPSHGDMSNQGYPHWNINADQSGTDEIFMAAQEAVGAGAQQRDSQDAAHYKKILKVEEPEIKQEPTSCEAPLKEEADIKQEQSTCEEEQQNSKDHKTCSSDSLFSATVKKNYVEIYNKGVDELIVPDMLENTPLSDFHEKNIDALWSASEKRKSFSPSSEANDLQVNKQLKLLPKESKNSNKLLPEQNSEIENSSSSDDCQFVEYKIKKTRIMPDRRTLGRKFIPRLCKQTNVRTSVSSCLPTVANDGSNLQICEDPLGNPSDILQTSVSSASGKSVIASHTQFTHVGNRTGSQEINSSITSSSNHFRDTQANKVKPNLVNKASLSSVSKKVFDVVSRFRKIVPAPQDNERTGTSCSPTVQEPNTNLKLTETVLSQPNTNTQQLQQLVTPGQYISYTNPIQTNTPSSRQHLQNSLGLQIQPQFTISPSQIQSTLLPQTSTTMTLPQPHISSTVQQIPGSALNLIQSGFSLPASTNIETITGMLQQSFTNSGEMVLQGRQSINSQSVLINQQGPSYAMQQPVFISSGSTSSQETPPQFIMPSRQGSLKKISVYKVVRTKNVGTSDVLPVDPLGQGVRLGRPPNRVGRPPNRLGRPPNRLSSPRYIRPQLTSYRRIEAKIVGEIEKENEVDQN